MPGSKRALIVRWGLLGCVAVLSGCSLSLARDDAEPAETEAKVEAPLSPEDQFLNALDSVPSGSSVPIADGRIATAEAAYNAASGRLCRMVSLESVAGGLDRRLACSDGSAWAWQPYVLP
jgi:hypothetical protein